MCHKIRRKASGLKDSNPLGPKHGMYGAWPMQFHTLAAFDNGFLNIIMMLFNHTIGL